MKGIIRVNYDSNNSSFDSLDNLRACRSHESQSTWFAPDVQSEQPTQSKMTHKRVALFNQLCGIRARFIEQLILPDHTFVGMEIADEKIDQYFRWVDLAIDARHYPDGEAENIMIDFNIQTKEELQEFCNKWNALTAEMTKNIMYIFVKKMGG